MGTNYYWHGTFEDEFFHIGKSSCGWHFALHVYPEYSNRPHDIKGWLSVFKSSGYIKNEYGDKISKKEMVKTITERKHVITEDMIKLVELGICTLKFDYEKSHAEPGLHGLAKHKINGWSCIGHGDGTWDYMIGDFS